MSDYLAHEESALGNQGEEGQLYHHSCCALAKARDEGKQKIARVFQGKTARWMPCMSLVSVHFAFVGPHTTLIIAWIVLRYKVVSEAYIVTKNVVFRVKSLQVVGFCFTM